MRRLPLAASAVSLALLIAGCGGGKETSPSPESVEGTVKQESVPAKGDPQAGKQVYSQAGCGGCHTLKAAGSSGTVGPNLDDLKPGYEAAFKQVQQGGGAMPAFNDKLSKKQIADVAAFVAESAGG